VVVCSRRTLIVLHDDEAIRILLVFPELEVSPLHCDELAAAKARAQCHQEQRVILRTNLFCSLEKLSGLRRRQRNSLDFGSLRDPREPPQARSRVYFDESRPR